MLHPINVPGCIHSLWKVVFIQKELLILGSSLTVSITANHLRSVFDQDTVDWLWHNKQRLIDPLEPFINHTDSTDKQAIVSAYQHDITYHEHIEDTNFEFKLLPKANPPCPSSLAVDVSKWLGKFYDVLVTRGVPATVADYRSDVRYQHILDEFQRLNSEMFVCPTCDGTWVEQTSTGIIGSIDHFLPRSKYPALSVHPFNLIPICTTCNERLKEDKDPLADNQPRTLADVFFFCAWSNPPRPARNTTICHVNSGISSSWYLENGQATNVQMSLFPDIFDIPGRWQQRADEIDRIVRRRLRDSVDASRLTRTPVDQHDFHALINRLEERMRDEWGEGNYIYPATYWLRWLHKHKFNSLAHEFLGNYADESFSNNYEEENLIKKSVLWLADRLGWL